MKKRYQFTMFNHIIFACPRTLDYRSFKVVILQCLVFWAKKRKTHFFKNYCSLAKFSTSSLCACEQVGAPNNKTLKKVKFLKKRIFYDFLKSRNFQNLTKDFENRTNVQLRPNHASFGR